MNRYTKKPATVEACQVPELKRGDVQANIAHGRMLDWLARNSAEFYIHNTRGAIRIKAPYKFEVAVPGEYIVRDTDGFRIYNHATFSALFEGDLHIGGNAAVQSILDNE